MWYVSTLGQELRCVVRVVGPGWLQGAFRDVFTKVLETSSFHQRSTCHPIYVLLCSDSNSNFWSTWCKE
ncbi:hypothetical protein HGRIS_014657 [Hohenbuehelia grisea]|uniref:Uncharacterized protein n=1 Tax=Hohenbuehelia grisea TaxID=104357 RepID=A0ABR3JVX5_9AGAR